MMSAVRSIVARLAHEERGMGMFEVLMSAVILAIVSIGVLKTFDAAGAQSGFNKARATAADLATENLERLRGYRASQFNSALPDQTRTVAGVAYTVKSTATWMSDDSGARSCTSDGSQIEYVKLTSTVTWPTMKDGQQVTQTTLYAPPKGSFGTLGAMAVKVVNAAGQPVSDVRVSATGPGSPPATLTNSLGCVYFPYIATGNYTVSISKGGYIDPKSVSTPSATVGVNSESVTNQTFEYDLAAAVGGVVKTRRGTASTDVQTVTNGVVTMSNSQLDVALSNNVTSTGAFSFPTVYPFTGAYSVSPGNCDGTTAGGQSYTVAPGSTATTNNLTLYKPSAQVKIDTNPGYTISNMKIVLSPVNSAGGCADKTYYGKATSSSTTNTTWWLSTSSAADSPGNSYKTSDSWVNYGTYHACISGVVSGYNVYWRAASQALTDLATVDPILISSKQYNASTAKNGYEFSASTVGC